MVHGAATRMRDNRGRLAPDGCSSCGSCARRGTCCRQLNSCLFLPLKASPMAASWQAAVLCGDSWCSAALGGPLGGPNPPALVYPRSWPRQQTAPSTGRSCRHHFQGLQAGRAGKHQPSALLLRHGGARMQVVRGFATIGADVEGWHLNAPYEVCGTVARGSSQLGQQARSLQGCAVAGVTNQMISCTCTDTRT
jgi:hypothetical protein